MSDITKTIRDNFESLITSTLTGWTVTKNKYDIENGHQNNQTKKFGVIIGAASAAANIINKSYTLDREFELTMLNKYVLASDIDKTVDIIEDALDDIIKAAIHNKLGSPQNVLEVSISGISAIDLETVEKVVIIKASFSVKYRNLLS